MPTLASKTKIRVMLVDDHLLMRMGLSWALNNEPDMAVVAEAEDGSEAVEVYRSHRPDVVILDLRMPRRNGINTLADLRKAFGPVRVLVLSNYSGGDDVGAAIHAGAAGYLAKDTQRKELVDAIRRIHSGESYVPASLALRLTSRMMSALTNRESEVLALIARGNSNKEIGSELHLAEGTVKLHVTSILSKLEVMDRTQAVLVAVKRGILQLE